MTFSWLVAICILLGLGMPIALVRCSGWLRRALRLTVTDQEALLLHREVSRQFDELTMTFGEALLAAVRCVQYALADVAQAWSTMERKERDPHERRRQARRD